VQSTWVTYRSQIEIGLALLAYMMFLIGSVTVLRANPDASWRYAVAVVPVLPAALVVFLFVRRLTRSTLAGAFAGFVCGFSGLMVGYITNFNQIHAFAWVPLVLYGLQLIREGIYRPGTAVTAVAVALMWLAGHPQVPVYATYLAPKGVVPPARSTVQVARLPKDALVEIEVTRLLLDLGPIIRDPLPGQPTLKERWIRSSKRDHLQQDLVHRISKGRVCVRIPFQESHPCRQKTSILNSLCGRSRIPRPHRSKSRSGRRRRHALGVREPSKI